MAQEENKSVYEKAGVLMQSALKKYAKGDIEGGDADRREANELYDSAEAEADRNMLNISTNLYGENRNFGIIYKVIEENAKKMYESKDNQKLYAKLVRVLTENKLFKEQFDFYNSIINAKNIDNAELYVNEVISIAPKMSASKIYEMNDKLINALRESNIDELVEIDDTELKLFESIEYLLLNKKQYKNLSEYTNAKNLVIEYVKNNKEELAESVNIDKVLNSGINEITDKYNAELNDDEKELIKTVATSKNKEKLFKEAKEKAIKALTESLPSYGFDDKREMKSVIESLQEKVFNEKTVLADIAEFMEISNVVKD